MKQKAKKVGGFTILEMLLSVAIISLLAGIMLPAYYSFQVRNDLDVAEHLLTQSLRRAQVLARSGTGDSSWGVSIATSTITLFQGSSYATRNVGLDEVSSISASIIFGGTDEYVFELLSGELSEAATTTFTSINNEVRVVPVNKKGVVGDTDTF